MKKLTLLAFFALSIQILSAQVQFCYNTGSGPAVCTPEGITQVGLNPNCSALPPLINGELSSTVIEFKNWDSIANPVTGAMAYMDSLMFDSIGNLPAGLCWATNEATNTFGNSQNGCIVLSGTTCAPPGQYELFILVTVWTNPPLLGTNPTGPIPLSAMGTYYYVRVNNSGQGVLAIDTNGQASGDSTFISYGNQANCQAGPPSVSLGANQTVCNNSNLILDPVITGGAAPYSYSWQSSGNTLSCNACANPGVALTQNSTFTLAVTDANNYVAVGSVTYTVSATNNLVQVSPSNSNISCSSSIDTTTLTVSNGTLPLALNWGDGNTQTGISSLSPTHQYAAAGVYPIAVTDASGCESAVFDTVLNTGVIITLNNVVKPHCWGLATGSMQVSATGGTPPYTYSWSNSATTNTISGIAAGYYGLTVTDNTGCSAAFYYYLSSLSDPWGYYTYLNANSANCNNNGSVNSSVYGGLPPFSYLWSNGSTSQSITGLSSGTYNLTVSDSAGCQTTGGVYVNSNCYSYINGFAFADSNGNCIYDEGDVPLNNIFITAVSSGGDEFYANTDYNGNYTIAVNDTGNFSITAYDYFYGYSDGCGTLTFCNNNNPSAYVPVLGDTVTMNNIGLEGATGYDLAIHPGWTSADPGFQKEYWVMPYNQSSLPFPPPATVVFTYDPNLIYQYSLAPQPAVDTVAHTLTWVMDSVPSPFYDWDNFRFQNFFMVPASLSLNYLLQSDFRITPTTGDCDTSNNHYHYSEVVTGSHDPNSKAVEPAGPVTADDSILTYTIYFQNTGTDSTHFVVIKDTLSPYLNPATVRNIASSDKYSAFNVSGKGILTWTFNPLQIVDSATNPSGSKRFIMFTVKKFANVPIGTTISNTASVYFDYNAAVVTNTVIDTESLPLHISEVNNSNISVKAFPNPFSDVTNIVVTGLNQKFGFELYDVTGRLQQSIPSVGNNQFEVRKGQLANGVYLYRIIVAGMPVAYGKLVIE